MKGLRWLAPLLFVLLFAAPAQAIPPGWAQGGSIVTGRDWHTATLLNDGSVLIAGGYTVGSFVTASAERYFPATGAWQPAGNMVYARTQHAAVLLGNGKVLVAGGAISGGGLTKTAELYD